MEDFLALDGQNAGEDALGETGTENDNVILFIHIDSKKSTILLKT